MKPVVFLVAIGITLAGTFAPTSAALAHFPRTVEEQVAQIAEEWTLLLHEDYGEQLPEEIIGAPRRELVEGLRASLDEPLSLRGFAQVKSWALLNLVGSPHPPCQEELSQQVRTALWDIRQFLARPYFDPEVQRAVSHQIAQLLASLEGQLVENLAPLTDDRKAAARIIPESIFLGGTQHIWIHLQTPASPVFKRPFTPEEMAALQASVNDASDRCWEDVRRDLATLHTPRAPRAEDLRLPVLVLAQSFAHELAAPYFRARPPMLSASEQQALEEAWRARYSQGGEAP